VKLEKQIIPTNTAVTGAPLRQAIRMDHSSSRSPRYVEKGNEVVENNFTEPTPRAIEVILQAAGPSVDQCRDATGLIMNVAARLRQLIRCWIKHFNDIRRERTALGRTGSAKIIYSKLNQRRTWLPITFDPWFDEDPTISFRDCCLMQPVSPTR